MGRALKGTRQAWLQGNCRATTGQLQGNYRTSTGQVQDLGQLQGNYRAPTGHLQGNCRTTASYLQFFTRVQSILSDSVLKIVMTLVKIRMSNFESAARETAPDELR